MKTFETLERKTILLRWWQWYFFTMPKKIIEVWKNFLKFGLYYFSVPLLLTTLFSYWHKYKWSYPSKGFDLGKILEAAFSNLISRVLGFIIRVPIIILGTVFDIFIFLAGFLFLFVWFFLPVLLIFGFLYGFKLLF